MRSAAPLLLLGIVLTTRAARGAPVEPAVLVYDVAAEVSDCPDADGMRGAVATRLGYDPFRDAAPRTVRARIQRAKGELEGRVELRDAAGTLVGNRTLSAAKCEELASAMAFAISMAIDPVRALAAPAGTAAAGAPSIVASASPPPPVFDALPAPPRKEPLPAPTPFVVRIHLALGLAGFGPTAGVGSLVAAGLSVRHGAASVEIEGRFAPPSSEAAGAGRVQTSTLGGALVPCAHVDPVFVCGVAFLSALQGEAESIEAPEKATTLFAQGGLRLGASVRLHPRLLVEPFLDGLATLTRTRIAFRGEEVWTTRAFGVDGGARLVLPFP